jgi:hypothetical protein
MCIWHNGATLGHTPNGDAKGIEYCKDHAEWILSILCTMRMVMYIDGAGTSFC